MQPKLKIHLSAFMFLQYFIWGSWYVSMGAYLANMLKFGGQEIGAAYGAFAIGSMISPFFVGLIADRYFASEKMLGVLGLLGGAVLCLLPQVTGVRVVLPAAHPVLRHVRADAGAGQLAVAAPPAGRQAGLPAGQDPLRGRLDRRRRHGQRH